MAKPKANGNGNGASAGKKGKAPLRRPIGRPRLIKTPAEWATRVEAYVAACAEYSEPLTWTGLALALGFATTKSFYDYEKKPEFVYILKRSRTLVEHEYEKRLVGNNPTGSIFALKNARPNWTDRQEMTHTGPDGGPIQVEEVVVVRNRITNRISGIASRISGQPTGAGVASVPGHTNGDRASGR